MRFYNSLFPDGEVFRNYLNVIALTNVMSPSIA